MIPIRWHSRKGRTVGTKKDQWLPGAGGGELKSHSTGDFQDSGNAPHGTIMMDACHYAFV